MARQTPKQRVRRVRNAIRQPALAAHYRVLDQRKELKIAILERNAANSHLCRTHGAYWRKSSLRH